MSEYKANESQKKVMACRDHLCVVAGAGSGKTGTLVATLEKHLVDSLEAKNSSLPGEDRLNITNILALTFTDKAAGELRERLAQSFSAKRLAAGIDIEEVEFWRKQIAHLDRADIGTIHSYALRLVKENALALGFVASPSLEEGPLATGDLGEVVTDWLDQEDENLLGLLEDFSLDNIKDMLGTCTRQMSSWGLSELSADLNPPEITPLELEVLLNIAKEGLKELKEAEGKYADNPSYVISCQGINKIINLLSTSKVELLDNANIDQTISELESGVHRAGKWLVKIWKPYKEKLREALGQIVSKRSSQLTIPSKRRLLNLANSLAVDLFKRRQSRGGINFDDILSLAHRLLATNPTVRQREIKRNRLVFIDEFQDTNRLQANLLAYLLLPEDDDQVYPLEHDLWGSLNWLALPPRFGAFGDPKQSIYRFRGAEVKIMTDLREQFKAESGQVFALDHNYRSQAPLIEFFNSMFEKHLEKQFSELDHQRQVRPALYEGPHVVRLHPAAELPAPNVREGRAELQARALVRYLDELFSGQSPILVGEGRLPTPGDVAILFRKKAYMELFKNKLIEAGWKCRLALGDNPFDYVEVRAVLAAFQYLHGQNEELNLASVLRSPLGPVSDQSLLALAWPGTKGRVSFASYFNQNQNQPWPEIVSAADKKVLTELRELFKRLSALVGRIRPVEILEMIVEERKLIPLALMEDDGEDRVRALTTLMALSRSLQGNYALSPAEELLEVAQNWDARRASGEGEAGEDAISIMTVHGSKGLEFPVVVIAEADLKPSNSTRDMLISSSGQMALRLKGQTKSANRVPLDFERIEQEDRALDQEENGRLMYVAATRAKDHLVLLGFPPKDGGKKGGSSETWLDVAAHCPKVDGLGAKSKEKVYASPSGDSIEPTAEECLEKELTKVVEYGFDVLSLPYEVQSVAQAQSQAQSQPQLQGIGTGLHAPMTLGEHRFSVTGLANFLADSEAYALEKHLGLPPNFSWKPGAPFFGATPHVDENSLEPNKITTLSPMDAGSLFHATMEYLDPRHPEIRSSIAEQAQRLGFGPTDLEVSQLAEKVESFIKSPLGEAWRGGLEAGEVDFRELPFRLECAFGVAAEGITLAGTIDLFFRDSAGQGYIVDYKLSAYQADKDYSSYINQVRIYAQALTTAGFGGPFSAFIYFAGGKDGFAYPVLMAESCPMNPTLELLGKKIKELQNNRPLRSGRPGVLNMV